MLVQPLAEGLGLVRQHEHAVLSGELAARWTGPGGEEARLSYELILTAGVHDVAWQELDAEPRLDGDSGRPLDFRSYPLEEKLEAYREGIDRMERLHPWAGLLGSLHYTGFLEEGRAGDFLERERARRRRLRRELERGRGWQDVRERSRRDLRMLKLFDDLSLYLCLASPEVLAEGRPGWLGGDGFARPPGGPDLELRWVGPRSLSVDPFPFAGPVRSGVPRRVLPRQRYPDGEALRRAWEEADPEGWRLEVVPP